MYISILVLLFIFCVSLFIWQLSNFISIFHGSLYVKSDKDIIRFALNKAGLEKSDRFYELGSGNGDVLIEAHKLGANVFGFEISPYYYFISKLRTLFNPDIKIYFKNILSADIKKADVIYCYLLPNLLNKISPQLLKSNARTVISLGFQIINLPNEKVYTFKNHKIFIYFKKDEYPVGLPRG